MSKLCPLMHEAGKVIFVNNCTVRLQTLRHVDGIYAEWASDYWKAQPYINYSALLGLRKPVMIWTVSDSELTDAYFPRCLYLGVFPTAPFPNNNHGLRPSVLADRMFLEYGPFLDAMRGKNWLLTPHCVESDTATVNLFEVPGGYVLPVTLAGKAETASVRVPNVPGSETVRCEAVHPGLEKPVPLTARLEDGILEIAVPLTRGCAMVRLRE